MNNHTRYIILVALCLLFMGTVKAQDRVLWGTHTLNNDIYNPQRSHFNYTGGSVAFSIIPAAAGTYLDFNFKGTFWDQVLNPTNFKNDSIPKAGIINNYLNPSSIGVDANVDLFLLKFRTSRKRSGEFSFSARTNAFAQQEFSTGLWGLAITGNKYLSGNKNVGFLNANTNVDVNVQLGLGYRQNIAKHLGIGVQFSGYVAPSLLDVGVTNSYFLQDTANLRIEAFADGRIIASGAGVADALTTTLKGLSDSTVAKVDIDSLRKVMQTSALKLKNRGYGISLGIDYEPRKNYFLSAVLRDIGYINYTDQTKKFILGDTIVYDGFQNQSFDVDSLIDTLANFENYITDTVLLDNYYKYLPAKLTFGGGFPLTRVIMLRGYYSINILPSTPVDPSKLSILKDLTSGFANRRKELALSADFKFGVLNYIVNYSRVNNGNKYLGLSFVYRSNMFDVYLGFDKLFFAAPLAGRVFLEDEYQQYIPKTIFTPGMGLNAGVAMRIGRSNKKYDKLMAKRESIAAAKRIVSTQPKKVILLSDTMLVDTDGDGIQDIFDDCPLLKGALNNNGCPEPDSDGDGVIDRLDKCPNEYGLSRYIGCPIPDTDKDGINDEEDQCPQVPGVAQYKGCPIPDRDNDGVSDEEDQCPDVFGTKALKGCPPVEEVLAKPDTVVPPPVPTKVVQAPKEEMVEAPKPPKPIPVVAPIVGTKSDRDGDGVVNYLDACPEDAGYSYMNGCPDSTGVPLALNDLKTINLIVYFNTNTNEVGKDYYEKLKKIKELMLANTSYKLEVQGYADNVGKEEYNKALSERRAEEVRTYLQKAGIDASRMTVNGYGNIRPMKSNDTETTRKYNRRVVFKLSTN